MIQVCCHWKLGFHLTFQHQLKQNDTLILNKNINKTSVWMTKPRGHCLLRSEDIFWLITSNNIYLESIDVGKGGTKVVKVERMIEGVQTIHVDTINTQELFTFTGTVHFPDPSWILDFHKICFNLENHGDIFFWKTQAQWQFELEAQIE